MHLRSKYIIFDESYVFNDLIYILSRRREDLTGLLTHLEGSLDQILRNQANIPRTKYVGYDKLKRQTSENMNDVLLQLKSMKRQTILDPKIGLSMASSRKRANTSILSALGESTPSLGGLRPASMQSSLRNLNAGLSSVSLIDEFSDLEPDDFDSAVDVKSPQNHNVAVAWGSVTSPPRNLKKAVSSEPDTESSNLGMKDSKGYFVRPDELHPLSSSSTKKYYQVYESRTVNSGGMLYDKPRPEACEAFRRHDDVIVPENNFTSWFDEESNRNSMSVVSTSGTVEITAVQALHLPVSNRPVFVKVSYGGTTFRSGRTPPTAHPAWVNEEDIAPQSTKPSTHASNPGPNPAHGQANIADEITNSTNYRNNHTMPFVIDTFNSKGVFHIAVMVDDFPHNKEIAKLDISVFNLLDCICILDADEVYDM